MKNEHQSYRLNPNTARILEWCVGENTFKTSLEVWKGFVRAVKGVGYRRYPNAVRPDRVREIISGFVGDPDIGLTRSMNQWNPLGGTTRMTWVVNALTQYASNRWRDYSLADARSLSTMAHADRGGASFGQSQDRLMADHGHAYQSPNNSLEVAESMGRVTRRLAAHKFGARLVSIWKMRLAQTPNGVIANTLSISQSSVSTHWEHDIRPIVAEEFPELVALRK